jgi:hypothetical protein
MDALRSEAAEVAREEARQRTRRLRRKLTKELEAKATRAAVKAIERQTQAIEEELGGRLRARAEGLRPEMQQRIEALRADTETALREAQDVRIAGLERRLTESVKTEAARLRADAVEEARRDARTSVRDEVDRIAGDLERDRAAAAQLAGEISGAEQRLAERLDEVRAAEQRLSASADAALGRAQEATNQLLDSLLAELRSVGSEARPADPPEAGA